jgi:ABC-type dipeptide/oligopeptide/nickel transport system permease component
MRYLAKRILLYIPVILLATVLVFLLMRVIPGDPALLILVGASGEGSFKKEDLANLRESIQIWGQPSTSARILPSLSPASTSFPMAFRMCWRAYNA